MRLFACRLYFYLPTFVIPLPFVYSKRRDVGYVQRVSCVHLCALLVLFAREPFHYLVHLQLVLSLC